ncbi:MAG: ATP-binding protein [Acidobacteriota bacterium]
MGLRTQIRRHSGNNRSILFALGLLFLLLAGAFYYMLYSQDLEPRLINNRVLLFALWYINVVLILAVLVSLLRIVFKMLMERKLRLLGSKFKTKLIATYIGLALFPVLVLFVVANQLFQGSVERFFSVSLEQVVDSGRSISALYTDRINETNRRSASRAPEALSELGPFGEDSVELSPQDLARLANTLRTVREESGIDLLVAYEGTEFLRGELNPATGMGALPDVDWKLLRKAISTGEAQRTRPLPGQEGRLLIVAVTRPIPESVEGDLGAQIESDQSESDQANNDLTTPSAEDAELSPAPLVIVAGSVIPQGEADLIQDLVSAYQAHKQLLVERDAITASQLLLFLMITLLILLASSWVGLHLAHRVTVPIQALVRGTERLQHGDLDHEVEVDAGDELGVLVGSFNRMTRELASSRSQLEQSNLELAQTGLRQARERALIAAVLQNVAAGVISFNIEGQIFTCNGAARTMLKLGDALRGRSVHELWRGTQKEKLSRLLLEAESASGPLARTVSLALGGEWKTFEVTITPVKTGDGDFQGRVMVLEDITELLKAQKLAAWTEAARRIAHEIKNPLTPIKLSAERLLRKHRSGDPNLGDALEEAVEVTVREVGAMQTMVDEFSRYARMPLPQPTEIDLLRLIDETVDLYQNIKPGVVVHSGEVVGEIPAILRADQEQVKRALINLLDNAIEATDAPGKIDVTAELRDGWCRIHVADTGAGVPDEAKDKLFLPYFSTKGRGTGLGLAIVHRIVSDHHGRVRVERNHPSGSVFTVELPRL